MRSPRRPGLEGVRAVSPHFTVPERIGASKRRPLLFLRGTWRRRLDGQGPALEAACASVTPSTGGRAVQSAAVLARRADKTGRFEAETLRAAHERASLDRALRAVLRSRSRGQFNVDGPHYYARRAGGHDRRRSSSSKTTRATHRSPSRTGPSPSPSPEPSSSDWTRSRARPPAISRVRSRQPRHATAFAPWSSFPRRRTKERSPEPRRTARRWFG